MSDFSDQQKQYLEELLTKFDKNHAEQYQKYFEKNIVPYGEDMAGKDISKIEDRAYIRKVYNHAEKSLDHSIMAKNTLLKEGVKNAILWLIVCATAAFTWFKQ
jgi:hypothetical protein